MITLSGSLVAIVTPMKANGEVDYGAFTRLLQLHLDAGTSGIIVGGTTGEAPTLESTELALLCKHAKDVVAGRIPVIAGTGTNCTRRSIALGRLARDAGADASLVVTPYYNKPTQEGLRRHYRAIADAVEIPVVMYNVPGRTGVDLEPETAAELSAHPRIIALKEATTDAERFAWLGRSTPDDFSVLSGDDASSLDVIRAGAHGVISVTANVAPRAMHEMTRAALNRDYELAAVENAKLEALHKALFVESNPIPVKWALHRMGLIPVGIRLPLTPLAPSARPEVEKALLKAGVTS